jgi:hypothetical protein
MTTAIAPKKQIRRWAKRPTDPNHDANAFLSVRDVHLIVRELESYAQRIANLTGRAIATDRRRVRALIEKLHAVRWP